MAARNNQAHRGQFCRAPCLVRFQKNRVNVPLEMIHRYERLSQRLRQRFSISNANQQRPHEARPLRHANGIHIRKLHPRLRDGFAHHRHDLPQVFARRQLRHHAAIFPVHVNLRSYDARQNLTPVGHHRRRRFIARRFNAQYAHDHR